MEIIVFFLSRNNFILGIFGGKFVIENYFVFVVRKLFKGKGFFKI